MYFYFRCYDTFHIIGWLANMIGISSLFPQLWKVWKTKSAKDISMGFTIMNVIAQILWIIYGIEIESCEIWMGSVISLILILILIFMKIIFDKKQFNLEKIYKNKVIIQTKKYIHNDDILNI